MTKRDIRKLAQASYKVLDEGKVAKISSLLKRKDLKEYIRQLRLLEKQQEVIIALPAINGYNKPGSFFEQLFSNKRITYQEDSSLLLGVRITDNDMVYDINLKARFEEEKRMIEQAFS